MLDLFQKCPDVLLLGYNSQTMKLIKILNKKYNIIPVLFADKRPKTPPIFARYVFWKQKLPSNKYYTEHTILDISKSLSCENPIIIPCSSHFKNIVFDNADFYENEYILCDINDIHAMVLSTILQK